MDRRMVMLKMLLLMVISFLGLPLQAHAQTLKPRLVSTTDVASVGLEVDNKYNEVNLAILGEIGPHVGYLSDLTETMRIDGPVGYWVDTKSPPSAMLSTPDGMMHADDMGITSTSRRMSSGGMMYELHTIFCSCETIREIHSLGSSEVVFSMGSTILGYLDEQVFAKEPDLWELENLDTGETLQIYDITTSPHRAYIALESGVVVYEHEVGRKPTLTGVLNEKNYNALYRIEHMEYAGHGFLWLSRGSTVYVLDIETDEVVARWELPNTVLEMRAIGDYVVLTTGQGVEIYDGNWHNSRLIPPVFAFEGSYQTAEMSWNGLVVAIRRDQKVEVWDIGHPAYISMPYREPVMLDHVVSRLFFPRLSQPVFRAEENFRPLSHMHGFTQEKAVEMEWRGFSRRQYSVVDR